MEKNIKEYLKEKFFAYLILRRTDNLHDYLVCIDFAKALVPTLTDDKIEKLENKWRKEFKKEHD